MTMLEAVTAAYHKYCDELKARDRYAIPIDWKAFSTAFCILNEGKYEYEGWCGAI